ncbi:TonB family domain-containing protein [Bartonella birtlesii LL-WM9]|uniref:TonB family domain-containing protein n=1 Tax=Bartonella birtlesii LL-WM9 TaxID=1094552 RepID=J0Q020_9HYPH|nr:TonB family protein [Bartonella birtlesii]EJF78331.1 TonB family domain-containing protein [Bartonella birtlesii LL-WM9]
MIFANTRRLLALWIGGFICAFSLHIALGAQFCFYSTGVSNGTPSFPIMLTFLQENLSPNFDTDAADIDTSLSNASIDPEILQPDFLEQDSEMLEVVDKNQPEESYHKDDLTVLKSLEELTPQKSEHEVRIQKTISKIIAKRSTVKAVRSSSAIQGGDTATREDALLIEWLAKIQEQLEKQKKYVIRQRISRTKGTVTLEFRVHEQGSIFSSRVMVSAGDPELDRLAMAVLQRVSSFPPPPPSKVNKIIRVSLIFS